MDTDETTPDPGDSEPAGAGSGEQPGPGEREAAGQVPPPPSGQEPPGAPPPPRPPQQLLRYPDGSPGAGVCAGLGAYFGVDPVLFRIAFVLLAFAGGAGLLLYIVAWAVMPEAGSPGSHASQQSPAGQAGAPGQAGPPAHAAAGSERTLQWVGVGLVVLAGLWLVTRLDLVTPPVLWAVALIVLGVLLFRGDLAGIGRDRQAEPPATAPAAGARGQAGGSTAGAAPPPAWGPGARPPSPPYWGGATQPLRATQAGPPATEPLPPDNWRTAPQPPPAPPQPSALGRLTLGAALLAGGAVALLDAAGVLEVAFRHYVALALLIVGLGLLLGTWWGRSRGLIAVGLVLIPVVLVAGVANAFVTVRGGVGERFFVPTEVAEVREAYELFAGQLEVDLTGVDFAGEVVAVRGQVTFGELVVLVPEDVTVEVDAAVGGGEILLPAAARDGPAGTDRPVSGLRVERRAVLEGEPGAGTLDLELTSGFGTITVRRAP